MSSKLFCDLDLPDPMAKFKSISLSTLYSQERKVLLVCIHSHDAWAGTRFMTWHETCRLWCWQIRVPVMMCQCSTAYLYERPCHILLHTPTLRLVGMDFGKKMLSLLYKKHHSHSVHQPVVWQFFFWKHLEYGKGVREAYTISDIKAGR